MNKIQECEKMDNIDKFIEKNTRIETWAELFPNSEHLMCGKDKFKILKCPVCDYERSTGEHFRCPDWQNFRCFTSHLTRIIMFKGDLEHIKLLIWVFGVEEGTKMLKKISKNCALVKSKIDKVLLCIKSGKKVKNETK